MPQLLDAPNEILLQIIAYTDIEDIESFSSCNKRIRLLFGPVLRLHVERKTKHSKTEIGLQQSQIRPRHAVFLLRDVLESPAIAHYPAEVVIGTCVNALNDWPEWSLVHHQEEMIEIGDAIAQCRDLLSAKLDACPYIETSEKQHWKGEICGGSECTAVAFLIMLFPNLKSITISDARFDLGRVSHAVRNVAEAQKTHPEASHPLQKLATVRLERSGPRFQAWFDFLEPFTGLSSVRLLTGRMVQGMHLDWGFEDETLDEDDNSDEKMNESEDAEDDGLEDKDQDEIKYDDTNESENADDYGLEEEDHNKDSDEDTNESEDADDYGLTEEDHNKDNDDVEKDAQVEEEYRHKTVGSEGGVTCLSLRDSAIDAGSFNQVLRGTKALQQFEYNYDPDSSTFDPIIWQPASILRYLLLYASHSLVSLNLTGVKGCSWNVCGGDSKPCAETPRQFQVLKQLYVQDGILFEGEGWRYSPQSDTEPWWEITKVHQMGDVLPASLEELTLFPSFDDGDHITDAFRGFPESKEHRLPRLKDIKLGGGLQLDESLKLACEKVGTSVEEV